MKISTKFDSEWSIRPWRERSSPQSRNPKTSFFFHIAKYILRYSLPETTEHTPATVDEEKIFITITFARLLAYEGGDKQFINTNKVKKIIYTEKYFKIRYLHPISTVTFRLLVRRHILSEPISEIRYTYFGNNVIDYNIEALHNRNSILRMQVTIAQSHTVR